MKTVLVLFFCLLGFEQVFAGGIRVGDTASEKICIKNAGYGETCFNPKLTVEKLELCARTVNEFGEADWTCEEKQDVLDILSVSAVFVSAVPCPHPILKVAFRLTSAALLIAHNRVGRVSCKNMEIEELKKKMACIEAKQEGLPCDSDKVDAKNFPKTKPKFELDEEGFEFE